MYTVSRILLILALTSLFRIDAANAQAIPKSIQQGGSDAAIKMRKNAWTVGLAGGLVDGTYMRFADELAKVLDDGDNLRILPMVSYGAATNLDDLLYLKGVDLAVTQSDVFEYFRTERKTPKLQNRVHYILRLPIAEVHILAKTDIRSLEDLRGKKVSFGPAGSGSSLTGTIVFQRLGVQVDQVLIDQQSALQKLQSGEVAALVRVVGKPVDFFTRIPPSSGLHLISITGALNALPNGSSQTGTNSWLRPVIQSGGTSTWGPRFRVGRGTLSPSRCLSVSTVLRYQRKRTSVAIFRPSKIASEPMHH
jgi:TRAP-type uncharacterized transport system substrate-binding protein